MFSLLDHLLLGKARGKLAVKVCVGWEAHFFLAKLCNDYHPGNIANLQWLLLGRSWAGTTQLSWSWIPDPHELRGDNLLFFSVVEFWDNSYTARYNTHSSSHTHTRNTTRQSSHIYICAKMTHKWSSIRILNFSSENCQTDTKFYLLLPCMEKKSG